MGTDQGKRFRGRRALVTGASRGIGAAIAEALAAGGADVAVVARTKERHPTLPGSLDEMAAVLRGHGANAVPIVANLADEEARATIVAEAVEGLGGPIDILVNNAAAGVFEPIAGVPLKKRRLSFEVNVHAPVDLMQAVIPAMRERGEGWIVNLSSGAGRIHAGPPFGVDGIAAISGIYGASKAALYRFTNALGIELYGTGIRVNTIEPAKPVATPGATSFVGDSPEDFGSALADGEFESMETMVGGALVLCDCGPDMTAGTFITTELVPPS